MTSKWARWRLKSPASRLLTQPFIQAHMEKQQSSTSLAFVRGIHRWPVNSPHIGPETREMFPFDDVIMMFESFLGTGVAHRNSSSLRSPLDSPHKGQWRGTLRFSLIYAWTNGWANNRDASDLRRRRLHYDVTVIYARPFCALCGIVWFIVLCAFMWFICSYSQPITCWIYFKKHKSVFALCIIPPHWNLIGGWNISITMSSPCAPWTLKSSASRLFAQPFVQAHIIENIKAPRQWPLWGESTGERWIPLAKGQ